jgi:hypothetical protein
MHHLLYHLTFALLLFPSEKKLLSKTKLVKNNIVSFTKVFLIIVLLAAQHPVNAQQEIFSENFENKILSPAWQIVSGNWHIADVEEKRIAPAENGYRYVLCSGGAGFLRLQVDIPGTIGAGKVKLSFSYYTYLKGPGATMEIEFHRKDLKDGLKGKMFKTNLPVKGRWIVFQKLLTIPAGANSIWVSFYETASANKTSKAVCFDNIVLSSVR